MNDSDSQSRAFFESRYAEAADPWQFASSAYELARYDATLAALSKNFYQRAYEPGCSIGVLTAALAPRCGEVVAGDLSLTAVQRAKTRCSTFKNVQIDQHDVADGTPPGRFDLIVFSELGYYFSINRLATLVQQLSNALMPGGEFIAVHWLGRSADHLLHGDAVHEVLGDNLGCDLIGGARHPGFRIDSWRRLP